MNVVDEIKARLDVVDVIGQSVRLKKAGRIYKGLCPFHSEKTPSFVVYPDQGTWHCFGACGTGGDIFTFVMRRDNLDFADSLKLLAERAGVELDHAQRGGDHNRQVLLDIHGAAAAYYHYLLKTHAAAGFAREYLERRRINGDSIETFELGFSPSSGAGLRDHLESKGFPPAEIEQAGLLVPSENSGQRDRFRGRLIFPIRNRRGQTIAFGARALDDDLQPKYLNSPDTALFSKSDVLYGLDLAKDEIRAQNLAVLVEGYTDVIVAHQEGFQNVVAALGTALTEKQLSQLQRLTKRYALALDADTAGEHATSRGLQVARQALERKQLPVPVGPGLIRFEERLQAELLIIKLPPGQDPDQVILESADRWRELVQKALPLVEYYVRSQTRDLDLQSAHGKSEAVRRMLPVINEIDDSIQREHYMQELARLAQVDPRTLTQRVSARSGVKLNQAESSQVASIPIQADPRYDEHLLALGISQPRSLEQIQFVTPDDFRSGAAREIWSALRKWTVETGEFDKERFLESLSQTTRAEAERLLAQAQPEVLSDLELVRELESAAYRLRLQRDREELTQLQYVLADSDAEEERTLYERADVLRGRLAESQRALQARSMLGNPSPAWTPGSIRG